ncbi:unnamed protein product, partial [Urochloa humidicola]
TKDTIQDITAVKPSTELFEDPLLEPDVIAAYVESQRRIASFAENSIKYIENLSARSKDKSKALYGMVEGAARAEKLETELAKMKEQYNKLSLLFDSAQAEKLTTRQELEQERKEAAEREAKLKTEEERLRKRNRTLTQ